MRFNAAQQRYNRRVLILCTAYALLLFAAAWLFAHGAVSGPLAYAVALAPAVPIVACYWLMGRYLIEETDEYLRYLQVRQLLIASGIGVTATTTWGFLEAYRLAPHVQAWAWSLVWLAGLGVGAAVNRVAVRRAA